MFVDHDVMSAAVGRRRVLLSGSSPFHGRSRYLHIELHQDGAGFAALAHGRAPELDDTVPLSRVLLEHGVLGLLALLVAHAVDVGAGGDALVLSQLLPAAGIPADPSADPPRLLLDRPSSGWRRHLFGDAQGRLPGTRTLLDTEPADRVLPLDAVAAAPRELVDAAAALAGDLLADFGLPTPQLLRPDGTLDMTGTVPDRVDRTREWAERSGCLHRPEAM